MSTNSPNRDRGRSLSQKLSLSNLRSKFKKNKDADAESVSSYYEEDHQNDFIPRLHRASSRLSLRSETRQNTRRNSQSSSHSNRLRQSSSQLSLRTPFGFEFTWSITKTHAANPPAGRSRANTLATEDVEGEYYDTRPPPKRGDALVSHPPEIGFAHPQPYHYPYGYSRAGRNDSAAYGHDIMYVRAPSEPEEEVEDEDDVGSEASDDTARQPIIPSPLLHRRPGTPPRARSLGIPPTRPRTTPARRPATPVRFGSPEPPPPTPRNSEDPNCPRCDGEHRPLQPRARARDLRPQPLFFSRDNPNPHPIPTSIRRSPADRSMFPTRVLTAQHPAFRERTRPVIQDPPVAGPLAHELTAQEERDRAAKEERDRANREAALAYPRTEGTPHLRRKRAVHFHHPEQRLGGGDLNWEVRAELLNRVEREVIERAKRPEGKAEENGKKKYSFEG